MNNEFLRPRENR